MDTKVRPPNRGCYSSLTGGGIASSNRGRGLGDDINVNLEDRKADLPRPDLWLPYVFTSPEKRRKRALHLCGEPYRVSAGPACRRPKSRTRQSSGFGRNSTHYKRVPLL